jgi:uncharacterized membrane protein
MKKRLLTVLHIFVWIAGTAFLVLGSFNKQLWFDESYSVGLVHQNLWDLIVISTGDVHPPFYYIVLKLYSFVFGDSLLSLRLFSVVFQSLLAGLGFTHIRRDFGEKVGFWYTTLFFLFASSFKYGNEIRMYSFAPVLVTLMAIYAYRFYKSGMTDKRSKVLFLVFGILGAYTHNYALAAVGAINFLFLLYCKKNSMLEMWKKMAKIQLYSYIYGFLCLVWQSTRVVGSFWIKIVYPEFIYKSLSFFMVGDVPEDVLGLDMITENIYDGLAFLFWAVCVWFFYLYYKKNKEQCEPAMLSLKTLGVIIGFYFVVALIRPLYYVRYLTVLSGLIVFFLAFAFDKITKFYIKGALLVLLAVVLVLRVMPIYENMYTPENDKIDTFIAENFQEGDIVVSDNIGLVAVLAERHPELNLYFYNHDEWDVELAYSAYAPQLKTVRDLSEVYAHPGRIWTLKNYFPGSFNELIEQNTDKKMIQQYDMIVVPYHNLQFEFTLFG